MVSLLLMAARARMNHMATGDPYAAQVVSLLHLDGPDGSTIFTDQKGHTWSALGAAKLSSAQSRFGTSSLYVNGSQAISAPDASGTSFLDFATSNWTTEAWVRIDSSYAAYGDIVAKRSAGSVYAAVELRTNGLMLDGLTTSSNTWYEAIASSPMTVTAWHHCAVVRSGTTLNAFVDGALVATKSIPAALVFNSATKASPLLIGALGDMTQGFKGYIDEVRITAAARYTTNFTPPAAPFPNP